MTAPTSMLLRFGLRGGVTGLTGRPIADRGHSVAARSGDCSAVVAADPVGVPGEKVDP